MRVGVYVDGFNLHYGARSVCGGDLPGWRWLDVRALASEVLNGRWCGNDARIERVVYCTARLSGAVDSRVPRDQDAYLRALRLHGSVDHIEFGVFVSRVKVAMLAGWNRKGRPEPVIAQWPVQVKAADGADVPSARFMVSCIDTEEKGSDVNVATHLLSDVLGGDVDAAIADDGVGAHWWSGITEAQYRACQLPDVVGRVTKPLDW